MQRAVLLLVLGAGLGGCAHGPPTPESKEVDSLTIEGAKQLSEGDVKGKILTGESSWLPWWVPLLGKTGWFDETSWQADLRRITRYYESEGYYQARVLEDQITDTKPGHVKVRVKVKEGTPAKLTKLVITGLDALDVKLRAGVLEDLPSREGDLFLEDKWQHSKALLGLRLRELGFAEASVDAQAVVEADAAKVEATLAITTGPRYRFGALKVATDPGARVPAKLVADVAQPDLPPTDYTSDSALEKAQGRVQSMGVFAGVKVNEGAPDKDSATVPVAIEVHEALFNTLRAGFGLNGDFIKQEVHLLGEYTNRDLGFARLFSKTTLLDKLTVKARVGWAFVPTVLAVAANTPDSKTGPIFKVTTEYEIPRVFDIRTVSFLSSLILSRALEQAFDYYGAELKVGFLWRPRLDLSIYPSANLDTYFVNAQKTVRDNVPAAALGCVLGRPCVVTFLDVLTQLDRRDNKLEPKEGYYLGLDLQGGVAQTEKLRPFFRVVPEARGYVSFGGKEKRFTIAGKLKAGTLVSTDNQTPIVVRFFSGGSDMRGFNQRHLSPLVAVPTLTPDHLKDGGDPNVGETLPVGGNGLLEGSVELRWNLWGDLTVAIFNDWGMVTAQPLGNQTNLGQSLYAAVGFGVRYRTPLGPIRIDLGYRLPFVGGPQVVDSTAVNYFYHNPGCFLSPSAAQYKPGTQSYAGAPDGLCNFHLSIGEAF